MTQPSEVECMAKNIYFESRNQSYAGQLAVAHVTLNRVVSEQYPNTICAVVHQGRQYADGRMRKHQCQFSWYCDGLSDTPKHLKEWASAKRVAQDAARIWLQPNGDITNGAMWYHSKNVSPKWRHDFVRSMQIDDHIFYRLGD